MKRKKRLEKGVESLKEQIEIHEEKKKKAEEADMKELVGYYEKEILSKEKAMREKKKLLDKQ
jgi:hypothetical protein